ncbi:MAG TPA: hypothetical protein VMA30_20345 [Xanthobacteraceae bacterium]|nr:hypothetical protein [Xanthobacteraceae bacterium]
MSSTHTLTSVPAVRYREGGGGRRVNGDREALTTGVIFAVLAVAGTALFFAVAPRIADIASLYLSTT